MPRYILFSFCLIFFFSNNVQATIRGATDTSSGHCDLTEFDFGQVKVGKVEYDNSRCELAICEEGAYTIRRCFPVPEYDSEHCEQFTKFGKDVSYPDCCPVILCETLFRFF
uniref:U13-Sparatoxin-Hju1s_1 n=1 Tax=Heteropoda jugulans TaxID=1358901 RepID=A0A4Q8KD29_9ARAC